MKLNEQPLLKKADAMEGAKSRENLCPSCNSDGLSIFYEIHGVPVHSVLLMPTKEKALNYPKGDISLGFCPNCGFISNVAFDLRIQEYSDSCEETQAFSPTFNTFAMRLAKRLITRYNLHNKDIIEIGCGKGEFLTMLCELGDNRGVGFDVSYVPERNLSSIRARITFIKDFYSEKYANYQADFVCCKMTLEHIQDTAEFIGLVRRSLGDQRNTIVFFQVPDVTRVLREQAFWDIYYEHCSYFSPGSLARLFRKCGFDVIDLATDYDDQYLMIEARPGCGNGQAPLPQEENLEELTRDVKNFSDSYRQKLAFWNNKLRAIRQKRQRAVIWGASSKGVAFLTTLKIQNQIDYVVDINPYKHGTYMAGSGQQIVGPDFLAEYKPDIVIAMNPIYRKEIGQDLNRIGLEAELVTV